MSETLVILTRKTFERLRARVMASRIIVEPPLRAKPTRRGTILALTVDRILTHKYINRIKDIACPLVPPVDPSGSGDDSDSSESASESESDSGDSGGGPGDDSDKTAIVPVELDTGKEWVQWVCAERPESVFELTLTRHGAAAQPLPIELVQSCEPGSLRAVSAQPVGALGRATARVQQFHDGTLWVVAEVAPLRASQRPGHVTVRVEGVRRGSPARWTRVSEQAAARNEAFWAAARRLE